MQYHIICNLIHLFMKYYFHQINKSHVIFPLQLNTVCFVSGPCLFAWCMIDALTVCALCTIVYQCYLFHAIVRTLSWAPSQSACDLSTTPWCIRCLGLTQSYEIRSAAGSIVTQVWLSRSRRFIPIKLPFHISYEISRKQLTYHEY